MAVGGSLLWDARASEVSAVRLAICGKPSPQQDLSLSFDHTGGLTGSLRAKHDALTVRLTGTVDLNRKGGSGAGLEVVYDLD